MFSRGLIISLGITTLCSVVTYIYFSNKMNNMEKKLNAIYDLVHTHTNNAMPNMGYNMGDDDDIVQNTPLNTPNNLITISENEESEEDDTDEDSEEESDSDEEDIPQLESQQKITQEVINSENDTNLGDLTITELPNESNDEPENLKIESLEINNDEVVSQTNDKELVIDNDDEDSLDELSELEENGEILDKDENAENEEFSENDLKKLTVATLKDLAKEKGLTNYKSLKKQPLINLLMKN